MENPVPCTTPGCKELKFFPGRCNPCQRGLEAEWPPLVDRFAGLTEDGGVHDPYGYSAGEGTQADASMRGSPDRLP